MKKICYFNLVTFAKVGGIENFNKIFLKALNELDFQIESISVYDHNSDCKIKNQFKNIFFKNFKGNKIKSSKYILKNIYKFDILIIAHINLLPIAIIAKLLNPKIKIFLIIYGIEVWKKLFFIYRIFLKKIKILSISKYTTNQFMKFNLMKQDNIFYLPPAIILKKNINSENPYNKKFFNILSVTRLDKKDNYKGVDVTLKAVKILKDRIPNIKYTIIGRGDDKKRLENLVKELDIEKYVEFKGYVETIEPYYQYCDIFVLPSKGEGFGIVYIEAMKYKKPCIACDIGGQTDVVIDGETGFLCSYGDIDCLVEKVITLYENEQLRKKFGENGYKHLINNFVFEKFKEKLKIILNGV